MKCSKCGFVSESDSIKFCPSCGNQILSGQEDNCPTSTGMETASPGRRWSARLFDLWLGIFVCGIVSGFLGLTIPDNVFLQVLIYMPFALLLEALEYLCFGGTFGKWVFSVKVLDAHGVKVSSGEYGKRLLHVWLSGMGLGIPLVMLIAGIIQYNRLKKGKAASYDEKAGRIVVQYKQGFVKWLVCLLFLLAILALNAIGNSME